MASIKDVARLAGVSISTVSRVISGSLPVEQEKRLKVEKAIREVNYHPDLAARGLRSKRSGLLGLVVPEIQHPSFTSILKYSEEYAEANGYNLVIGSTNNDPDKEEEFVRMLVSRHVDGLMISRVSDQSRMLQIIRETKLPVVVIDRLLEGDSFPVVVMDNYRAGVMAAEYLIGLGHEEFACITGPRNIQIVRERLLGFTNTIAHHKKKLALENIYEGDFKYDCGAPAITHLVESGAPFTAVWALNDMMAIGALNQLRRMGKSVPEGISIMGLDNIPASSMSWPGLTTIAQPFDRMCASAIKMIIDIRNGHASARARVSHRPTLVVRESAGRRS